jgi:hypothetical protein
MSGIQFNQEGRYQLCLPSNFMLAGTRTVRTIVASTRRATPTPKPICSKIGRRALSVAAMLLGALIGGLLVLKVDNPAPLALATGPLAAISFGAHRASQPTQK